MKYYHADSKATSKVLSNMTNKDKEAMAELNGRKADDEVRMQVFLETRLKQELAEKRQFKFAAFIDDIYHDKFLCKHSIFTHASEFLLPRDTIRLMYKTFLEKFPYTHSLFSFIVSSSRFTVELATSWNKVNDTTDDTNDQTNETADDTAGSKQDDELHKLECATLECVLSFI